MTEVTQERRAPRTALWRNTEVRAVAYQIIVLGAVIAAGYVIFRNTMANLAERGIVSGFTFLSNEAGFPIGETPPVPILEGGFLYFMIAIFGGLLGAFLLARWLKRQGKTIADDTRLVVAVIALIFVIPGIVLYTTGDTIKSVTYDEGKAYSVALKTGLMNTFIVSLLGCILATIFGLILGLARLSSNWLIARLATAYVEVFRNIPLLLQMFFWYFAVIRTLPQVRQSITLGDYLVLNNRGVYLPWPLWQAHSAEFLAAIFIALILIYFRARHVRIRQERTGEQLPLLYPSLGILVVLPALVWLTLGTPFQFEYPTLQGFNFQGGMVFTPEFTALLVALVMYTTTFIAEIVRSGIQSVSKGQREAASAVGLRSGFVMRLVILPQAMRVIIPPLTSQFLNLTKNSSLAVAIGFPELVSVGGTMLNQSGQAIEIIGIWMAVYLTISLLISLFMNWYNAKVKLVER